MRALGEALALLIEGLFALVELGADLVRAVSLVAHDLSGGVHRGKLAGFFGGGGWKGGGVK